MYSQNLLQVLRRKFFLWLLLVAVPVMSSSPSYRNVYGDELQSCSTDGMALTGYTRTGYCVDQNDDEGSHHICLDIASSNDDDNNNFCTATGQSDWCSSAEMPCHEDSSQSACSIEQWCVCQWAFASYLQAVGGCNQVSTLVCEAINLEAVLAYQAQQGTAKYRDALDCLVEQCGLDLSNSKIYTRATTSRLRRVGAMSGSWFLGTAIVALVATAIVVAVQYRQRQGHEKLTTMVDNKKEPFVDPDVTEATGYGTTV
jgi:uncharacterized protein (DUF2237 family)